MVNYDNGGCVKEISQFQHSVQEIYHSNIHIYQDIWTKDNLLKERWLGNFKDMKPLGLCERCKTKCDVLTETGARVIECPDFKIKVSPAKNSTPRKPKTVKNRGVRKQSK